MSVMMEGRRPQHDEGEGEEGSQRRPPATSGHEARMRTMTATLAKQNGSGSVRLSLTGEATMDVVHMLHELLC